MKKDNDLDFERIYYLPVWCEKCNKQGFILEEDRRTEAFIICRRCGWETSQVWCTKCHKGGNLIEKTETRPEFWICPNCKKKRFLPDSFYENPVHLCFEDELSNGAHLIPRFPKSPVNKVIENSFIGIGFISFLAIDYLRNMQYPLKSVLVVLVITIVLFLLVLLLGYWAKNTYLKKRNKS
jgi:hypothetical protein